MRVFNLTLQARIYVSMLALILLAFVVTGITSYYFNKQQNEDYHIARLERKEKSIDANIQHFLSNMQMELDTDSITSVFTDKICELSDVHRLPINLFDRRGQLLISSDPYLFEENDIPEFVDNSILKQLATGNVRAITERPGSKTEGYLAYWYFRDENKAGAPPLAIIGIPYLETQEINPEELKDFLIDLTKIFSILFVGAAILAYFLSNYITKSLQTIRKRMQTVDASKKNEPILWKSNDEIGMLVGEYNRMLKEVEKSADNLAKNERESAWREMAKQVAHEIKNPLTPMKLRLQYLERAWNDKDPDFEAKMASTSKSIIEQIDTLSNIASEFSNFAKMPKAKEELFDLKEAIESSLEIFKNTPNVRISFSSHLSKNALVMADREQTIRVFNNLIKNAVQAIPEHEDGKIDIALKEENDMLVAHIQDNGMGISEAQRKQIFVPNFTTKSTGTGLGLAMVKNIMESLGGDVWFETELGEGSAFSVAFPVAQESVGTETLV